MVQDRHSAQDWEIGAGLQYSVNVSRIVDLAGNSDRNSAAQGVLTTLEITDDLDQTATLPLVFFRLLERVPQRQVHEVDIAGIDQLLGQLFDLSQLHAKALGRQPNTNDEVTATLRTNTSEHFEQHPAAILEWASVFVLTLVELRAQELANDVAVRAVQLNTVEARRLRADGGSDEVSNQLAHLIRAERSSTGLFIIRRAHRGRADDLCR